MTNLDAMVEVPVSSTKEGLNPQDKELRLICKEIDEILSTGQPKQSKEGETVGVSVAMDFQHSGSPESAIILMSKCLEVSGAFTRGNNKVTSGELAGCKSVKELTRLVSGKIHKDNAEWIGGFGRSAGIPKLDDLVPRLATYEQSLDTFNQKDEDDPKVNLNEDAKNNALMNLKNHKIEFANSLLSVVREGVENKRLES